MPGLSQEEVSKYWEIFQAQVPQNGIVSGDKMFALLKNSQLADNQLERVWDLADIDGDGGMDFDEFCIAMRMVFDALQNPGAGIPATLPEWLVPAGKRHLVEAKLALRQPAASIQRHQDDDDDEYRLSTDFDWYISPSDRSRYLDIYSAHAGPLGQVSFDSMSELYKTLAIPDTDVSSAWNLVNPRSDERIDKEQCIVFLHILNKRSNRVRVPRSVPASLRATFGKEQPSLDINGKQAQIRYSQSSDSNLGSNNSSSASSGGFADSYLSRLGLGGRQKITSTGTDFSATKDLDWEEVRLRRELEDLDKLVAQVLAQRKERENKAKTAPELSITRRELQQLLDYKERYLKSVKSSSSASNSTDLAQAKEEIDLLDEQVQGLKSHLETKTRELQGLQAKLASF